MQHACMLACCARELHAATEIPPGSVTRQEKRRCTARAGACAWVLLLYFQSTGRNWRPARGRRPIVSDYFFYSCTRVDSFRIQQHNTSIREYFSGYKRLLYEFHLQ